jgi:hypothetical protein
VLTAMTGAERENARAPVFKVNKSDTGGAPPVQPAD